MSNQITPEEMQKRGEMLKRARQILVQEYTAIRSQQHQQWLRDSANNWKNKGVLIAYPPLKMHPTEQEVVSKALDLYNRSMQPNTNVPTISIEPTIQETDIDAQVSYSDAITPSITEQLQAAYNSPTTYSVVETREITEPPPTTTDLVQAGGDFVIIDEPIESEDSNPEVEPVIEEPVVEESKEESSPAKHSLLRSVLSGWLSKNKDKDVP